MAKLTAKQRAKLPAKDFGLPEKARSAEAKKETGNYPMPDEGHAISAKRLSKKQRGDGNLTKNEFERINRKADKVLKAKSEDLTQPDQNQDVPRHVDLRGISSQHDLLMVCRYPGGT